MLTERLKRSRDILSRPEYSSELAEAVRALLDDALSRCEGEKSEQSPKGLVATYEHLHPSPTPCECGKLGIPWYCVAVTDADGLRHEEKRCDGKAYPDEQSAKPPPERCAIGRPITGYTKHPTNDPDARFHTDDAPQGYVLGSRCEHGKSERCGGKPGEPNWRCEDQDWARGCYHEGWHEYGSGCEIGSLRRVCSKCPGCPDCQPAEDWALEAAKEIFEKLGGIRGGILDFKYWCGTEDIKDIIRKHAEKG